MVYNMYLVLIHSYNNAAAYECEVKRVPNCRLLTFHLSVSHRWKWPVNWRGSNPWRTTAIRVLSGVRPVGSEVR